MTTSLCWERWSSDRHFELCLMIGWERWSLDRHCTHLSKYFHYLHSNSCIENSILVQYRNRKTKPYTSLWYKEINHMQKNLKLIALTVLLTITTAQVCNATNSQQVKSLQLSTPETKVLYDNWQGLKQRHLRLIPVPKKIQFKGAPVSLNAKIAIIIDVKTEQDKIAINEINSRVQELTGKTLPIFTAPKQGFFNIIIENNPANFFTAEQATTVTTANPYCRKQAYGLKVVPAGIKLGGNSSLGMMYAAVTLRYLMEKSDGKALLYPANITDWPDFPRRLLTGFLAPYHSQYRNDPAKHFAYIKKFANWAFRLKCTMVHHQTFHPYYARQSPFYTGPMGSEDIFKSSRLTGDYLKARGISALGSMDVALGYKQDSKNPEVKTMMLNPVHKKYYSWARHDLHRKKAEKIGEIMKKSGYDTVYVHAVDGGGINDPELWSKREPLTRNKYGDDRVQADIDMFNIYIDILRSKNIDPLIVIYPYSGSYLQESFALKKLALADTPGNRKTVKQKLNKIKTFMQALNKKLPKDVPVCIRESSSQNMRKFYRQYPGRPMQIYFEVVHANRSIIPMLHPEISSFQSAFDPARTQNDILWMNVFRKFQEQAAVCGAEYSWNCKFPGWSDLDRSRTFIDYDPNILEVMSERAAVGLWGDKYGQLLKNIFTDQLSLPLAFAPDKIIKSLKITKRATVLKLLKNNFNAASKATQAMDEVWALLRNDKKSMDKFSYPIFITYYKMIKAAVAYAGVNYYRQLAYEAAAKGDFTAVAQIIKNGDALLKATSAEYSKTMQELKPEPQLVKFAQLFGWWRKSDSNLESNLLNPDFAKLAEKLNQISQVKEKIFERFNVPENFKDYLSKQLLAAKSSETIIIDGNLSENIWGKVAPIEKFINIKMISLPPNPVAVKIAYDKANLYISGEIDQPLLDQIKAKQHSTKEYAYTESVEIFLQPKGQQEFYQFVVDSSGGLYTCRKDKLKHPVKGINLDTSFAISRQNGKWSFELAIPFSNLGQPQKGWKVLIGLNSVDKIIKGKPQIATFASTDIKGKSFHDSRNYQQLNFVNKSAIIPAKVTLKIVDPKTEGKVHQSGTGTFVSFGMNIESSRPLFDLTVTANFMGKSRKSIASPIVVLHKKFMPLTWKSTAPIGKQLSTYHKGVIVELVARYKTRDGKSGRTIQTRVIGDPSAVMSGDSRFVTGKTSGSKAFSGTFYLEPKIDNTNLFSVDKGAIGFVVKPDLAIYDRNADRKDWQTLLHCGPLRPKYPTITNRNCMSIMFNRRYGKIFFAVANRKFERVSVEADIRGWQKNQWQHFDFVWNFTTQPITMQIYIDGKLKSGKVTGKGAKTVTTFSPTPLFYPIQWGAFNSGYYKFKGAIDQLYISQQPKFYKSWNQQHGVIFNFSDNLTGNCKSGKITGQRGLMPAVEK
jgi:glycosyl hydrolase family 20/cellulose/xylan binding protein with CBM9 domain